MDTQEIWKDIIGYEGLYQVSNLGRIKSFQSNRGIRSYDNILKLQKTNRKYLYVVLYKNKIGKIYTIHKLVMLTFKLNEKFDYKQVNHIDGYKENNYIDNLEWCTASENIQHAYDKGLIKSPKGENHGRSKLNENQVKQIRLDYKNKKFNQKQLSEIFNVTQHTIWRVINNKNWTHIL